MPIQARCLGPLSHQSLYTTLLQPTEITDQLLFKWLTLCHIHWRLLSGVAAVILRWRMIRFLTRLHKFARSLLYNATAGGALWWLRKTHIVNYAKHQHSPFARRRHDFRQAAARRFKLHFPPIVWWKFRENPFSRSRERLSHSFGGRKKTSAKHRPIRIRLLPEGGCVKY